MSSPAVLPERIDDPRVEPVDLRTEDDSGLVTVGVDRPLVSWRMASTDPAAVQRCFEVESADDQEFRVAVKSTGAVVSDRQHDVSLPGPALRSRQVRWWRVRISTDRGWSRWSRPARLEAGLLYDADWVASPVALGSDIGRSGLAPASLLRREFDVPAPVRTGRLYVTALGVHDTRLNGRSVTDNLLEPGWTSYPHRLLYAAYDVTELLREGPNALTATVGDGWYRGTLTWLRRRNVYGAASALLAQLELMLVDGRRVVVATDGTWRAATGEIRSAGLYEGSTIDLRLHRSGWQQPGYDDRSWHPAVTLDRPGGLAQRAMPPVRVLQVRPAELTAGPDGAVRVDTGQVVTGYLRVTVTGARDATVTVRHAEVLAADGALHTAALRHAVSVDRYVLADDRRVTLEPAFTFHGFRYADITADPAVRIVAADVLVIASDLARTGRFACSDERINRLYENVVWSQRGNFLALPTDCPQRDERLGWTGDIQVFAAAACHSFDSRAFLTNWLRDLAAEQRPDGCLPNVVPNVLSDHPYEYGAAGWADAVTVVPFALHEAYGDTVVLAEQYDTMRRWVEWGLSRLDPDGLWSGDFHFGDWLDPNAPSDQPEKATTDTTFVATAYLAHSARLLARAAGLLGRDAAAEHYAAVGDRLAGNAWHRFADHATTTQTGCAIALELRVAPAGDRARVGAALAQLVRSADGRIATGFLGTPLVLPALTATGHHDEAYRLLVNENCPGWLYQVRHGATTVWERWDAIRADGTIHRGEMSHAEGETMLSFNHYAYGAVAAWLFRTVAGLGPDRHAPGYRTVVFAPVPGGGLRWARASMRTGYGDASIHWVCDATTMTVDLQIPPGAGAVFVLPPGRWSAVHDGDTATDVDALRPSAEHGRPALTLGAGAHRLVLTGSPGASG